MCKIFGLFLGYWLLRSGFGAIVGLLIGLCLDEIIQQKIKKHRAISAAKAKDNALFNEAFIHCLIGMFVKLALVDGKFNKHERRIIDKFVKENFKNSKSLKPLIEESIKLAINSNRTLNSYAIQFLELSGSNKGQVRFIFATLLEIAMADSVITTTEKDALLLVAEVLGLKLRGNQSNNKFNFGDENSRYDESNKQNAKSEDNNKTNNDDVAADFLNNSEFNPYSLLGCSPDDSDEVIKKRYVELVQEYHPDKIYAKDLPQDFIKFANYKFDLIQNAYKRIKEERGMK